MRNYNVLNLNDGKTELIVLKSKHVVNTFAEQKLYISCKEFKTMQLA